MGCSKAKSMENLKRASQYRQWRAQLKRDIAAGRVSPLEALQSGADYLQGMPIAELLLAVHNLGPQRVNLALDRLQISPRKRVGTLTERQVWALDERLSTQNAWCQSLSTA